MKNKLRKVLIGVLSVAVAVMLVIAMVHSRNQKCESIEIAFAQSNSSQYFTEQQALQLLKNSSAYPVGKRVREIDADAMKKVLAQNPWFNDIQDISADGSNLTLTISVSAPISRVFPLTGESFILGNNGALLPDDTLCPNLIVISGNISTTYAPATNVSSSREQPLVEAYRVALQISKSAADCAQFPQIFVGKDGQLELYSTLGEHAILIGDAADIAGKLANIRSAYANGILYLGSENYSSLDARFPDRIYARKTNL